MSWSALYFRQVLQWTMDCRVPSSPLERRNFFCKGKMGVAKCAHIGWFVLKWDISYVNLHIEFLYKTWICGKYYRVFSAALFSGVRDIYIYIYICMVTRTHPQPLAFPFLTSSATTWGWYGISCLGFSHFFSKSIENLSYLASNLEAYFLKKEKKTSWSFSFIWE